VTSLDRATRLTRVLVIFTAVLTAAVLVVSIWAWQIQRDTRSRNDHQDEVACQAAKDRRAELQSSLEKSFGILIDRIVANTDDPARAAPIGEQTKQTIAAELDKALARKPASCIGID